MSALDYVSQIARGAMSPYSGPAFSPAVAVGQMVTNTGVGFGASVALGEVYGRYAELPGWKGKLAKNAPEVLGGTFKLAEFLATLFLGQGWVSGLTGALGQVGVNAIGLEMGLEHARKDLGITISKLPPGAARPKRGDALPAGSTALGALPPAEDGRGLAWGQIRELSHMH